MDSLKIYLWVVSILAVIFLVIIIKRRRKGVVIRTNVLFLMTVAYLTVIGLFLIIVQEASDLSAENAWDILEGPLMALIGGTLAISKDLIDDRGDDDPRDNKTNKSTSPSTSEGKQPLTEVDE